MSQNNSSQLHANDCVSGLRRLKSLISQHPFAPRDIDPDIALAVNVMVNIARSGTERRIKEIVAVKEYDPNQRQNNGYRLGWHENKIVIRTHLIWKGLVEGNCKKFGV